ncbi:MAG: superoxide dismutase [Bacteroidales bacterium]|nr:superoxide dismutase [Bacteroidales bacterium]
MLNTLIKELKFSELPYAYDALEPYIDAKTMELHYTKHHRGYYDKLMAAIKGTDLEDQKFGDILGRISKVPAAVRNNGGGFINHDLFWNTMGKNIGSEPSNKPGGEIAKAIDAEFGSFEKFKQEFSNAAATRFGSGWAWLIVAADGNLKVSSTPNQDNPLMDVAETQGTPILGLDVWEHAYYLKYQNRRPDYIENWFNVVNWDEVTKNFKNVKR